ncbi:cathepsin K isoform X2 [Tenebrio molitor]|uniref:cathepsin K isoform X2 n=1 Tax=Tenebrio molitor TaxID=7067 RepID=UPI0036248A34
MKTFVAVFVIVLCPKLGRFQDNSTIDLKWEQYKEKYNKTYYGYHDAARKLAWEANLEKIRRHNDEAGKGLHSYYINDNHLSDMSTQSYLQKMVKLTKSRHRKVNPETVGDFFEMLHHIPEELNWIDKGFQTPTYNQKDCGSCYAFSIAGVLQGQVFKQTDKLIPLSEQQIVDCSVPVGNYGCGGGSLRNTLKYLDKSGGLMTYTDYPYVARQTKCRFDKNRALVNLTSWAILPARDERALEIAVAKIGPIAASLNAAPHTFQLSGVYDDVACSPNVVNHAVLIVGYTKDAWILKNWWGNHWGEKGYMRLRRGRNRCGIANYAAYALV